MGIGPARDLAQRVKQSASLGSGRLGGSAAWSGGLYANVRHYAPVTTLAGVPEPVGTVRRWIRRRPADVIDLFVYVVVLNLVIEYIPSVISESFSLSLLTAALLKVSLELVLRLKNRIVGRMRAATTRGGKSTAALMLWVVAAGSKVVVLELVDLVFGDAVSLGSFWSATLLVISLLVARAAVRRLLYGVP